MYFNWEALFTSQFWSALGPLAFMALAGPVGDFLYKLTIWDGIGTAGTILLVTTYWMLQTHRIDRGMKYSVLNLLASSMLLISLLHTFNLASFLIELFWIGISIHGIREARRLRQQYWLLSRPKEPWAEMVPAAAASMSFRGQFDPGADYYKGDSVVFGSSMYVLQEDLAPDEHGVDPSLCEGWSLVIPPESLLTGKVGTLSDINLITDFSMPYDREAHARRIDEWKEEYAETREWDSQTVYAEGTSVKHGGVIWLQGSEMPSQGDEPNDVTGPWVNIPEPMPLEPETPPLHVTEFMLRVIALLQGQYAPSQIIPLLYMLPDDMECTDRQLHNYCARRMMGETHSVASFKMAAEQAVAKLKLGTVIAQVEVAIETTPTPDSVLSTGLWDDQVMEDFLRLVLKDLGIEIDETS